MINDQILYKAIEESTGKWVKGYCIKVNDIFYILPIAETLNHITQIRPETLCQYIGIKDKNGKSIFNSDLVKLRTGRICQVKFKATSEYCGFDLVPMDNLNCPVPSFSLYWNMEVVGNIYDRMK